MNESYHARNPQPGDYWHEKWIPVCVILEATDDEVIICRSIKSKGIDYIDWDFDKCEVHKKESFHRWLKYPTVEDYWPTVEPLFHCYDVDRWKEKHLRVKPIPMADEDMVCPKNK